MGANDTNEYESEISNLNVSKQDEVELRDLIQLNCPREVGLNYFVRWCE